MKRIVNIVGPGGLKRRTLIDDKFILRDGYSIEEIASEATEAPVSEEKPKAEAKPKKKAAPKKTATKKTTKKSTKKD